MDSLIGLESHYNKIEVLPLAGSLGAEIRGVDLSTPLDDDTRQEIMDAFRDYLVIYFPDQDITHAQHVAFAGLFGPVINLPQIFNVPDCPQLQEVKRGADDRGGVTGESWHTDSSFLPKPPRCIVMRAIEVPPYGGDTLFANLYLAYESLSGKMKEVLGGLNAVHSATKLFGSNQQERAKTRGYELPEGILDQGDKETIHPVICTHPVSGKKFIYVNTIFTQRFEGMTEAESAPILQFLYAHCAKLEHSCRVRWRKNQLLIWDNRATYHKAIPDYDGFARYLVRATIEGDAPAA